VGRPVERDAGLPALLSLRRLRMPTEAVVESHLLLLPMQSPAGEDPAKL
jgi:hypothetical protein